MWTLLSCQKNKVDLSLNQLRVSIHMKRFSRKWFSQIMIHKKIKHELDSLKEDVRRETKVNYRISYGDEIIFLIEHYKKTQRVEYPLMQSLLVGNVIAKKNLHVSMPLNRNVTRLSYKLDGKLLASTSLKS